jgi:hypothetical protein
VTMATLSKHIFGNWAFWIKQRVYSFHSNTFQKACVGLVLKDGMELLELVSLCVRFLPIVDYGPLEQGVRKEVGLFVWIETLGLEDCYQRSNISNTCQSLMKMVKCMEDENHPCHKGEIRSGVTSNRILA